MSKSELRKRLRALGRAVASEVRARASSEIVCQLSAVLRELNPQHVGLYMPLADEPDLTPLYPETANYAQLYLPRVDSLETMHYYAYDGRLESLARSSAFGLMEPQPVSAPVAPEILDVVVVPAMAFDAEGYRLGRGRGYYDRYLQTTRAYTIGVTLELLPIGALPRDEWDVPMDVVLRPETTPTT